jgi:hypothetical protein
MIQNIFQKYIFPIIIAAVFGSGGFLVKGCEYSATEKAHIKEIKGKDETISKYTDSVKILKNDIKIRDTKLNSLGQDSSIMRGQLQAIQVNDLALRNGNIRLKTELEDCEMNMKKAIETGIIEVKEKKTFLQKLFNRK